jgi:hypothetical protein
MEFLLSDGLPPGWASAGGVVGPAERVADYAARGQTVKGQCRSDGCYRKIDIDPHELVKRGFGSLSMRKVQGLCGCHRLEGCSLAFHNGPADNPLRLKHFVGRPNIRVRVRCRGTGCKFFRVYKVEQMIAGLRKRQQGDEQTEVAALGTMMTSPCTMCKRSNWVAEVLHINTDTIAWRAVGEKTFDDPDPERFPVR